jgi:hypothetical protein
LQVDTALSTFTEKMNCQAIQNKILNLPDTRVIPDALRNHVAGCEACRTWAEQAARLESLLEQLPVPPAPGNKKAELVDQLLHGNSAILGPLALPHRGSSTDSIWRFLDQNKVLIGGLAAAVLVVLGGWWLFTGPATTTLPPVAAAKDPFLEKMVRWDVDLAKAETPLKRLAILGSMADGLSNQTRSLARVANAKELGDLARWFDKVVKDGVVKQAEKMPFDTLTLVERADRKEQFNSLAEHLAETATQAENLTEVPQDARPTLQKIAKSAREGEEKLRKLANQG